MEYFKLPILGWHGHTRNHRRSLERGVEKRKENIRRSSSHDGTVLQSFFFSFDVILRQLTCGVLGNICAYGFSLSFVVPANSYRCVFGEMFKGKPILAGSSDLNQAQLIFNLVGAPNDENMPGWRSLPGCEGVKNFGSRPGKLAEAFREYGYTYSHTGILSCCPKKKKGSR